jgi:pilus assembly protein FimV
MRLTDPVEDEGQTVVVDRNGLDFAAETEPEIDFEEPQEEPVESGTDPEIKLDLARAYLSLGDKEASKSMLDEVLKSGNATQKAEARQMLDEL